MILIAASPKLIQINHPITFLIVMNSINRMYVVIIPGVLRHDRMKLHSISWQVSIGTFPSQTFASTFSVCFKNSITSSLCLHTSRLYTKFLSADPMIPIDTEIMIISMMSMIKTTDSHFSRGSGMEEDELVSLFGLMKRETIPITIKIKLMRRDTDPAPMLTVPPLVRPKS